MIRWLGADDLDQWRDIRSEALRLCPSAFLTSLAEFEARSDDEIRAQLAQGRVLASFDGETVMSTLAYSRQRRSQTQHRAVIAAVYTRLDARGTGQAADLMHHLIAHARTEGVVQLELSVEASNARAIGFYEKLGFQRFGTLPRVVATDQGYNDDYFYVLTLDS